jgi:hypothetical protein
MRKLVSTGCAARSLTGSLVRAGSTAQRRAHTLKLGDKVLASNRPRCLIITWAWPGDEGDAAETSRMTFEIAQETGAAATKLSVTDDELEADSKMFRGLLPGWPKLF